MIWGLKIIRRRRWQILPALDRLRSTGLIPTYSLVKDWVAADEGVPISVKGFSRPIQTYRVLGNKDERIEGKDVLLREAEGKSVKLDLSILSDVKKAEVEQMLNETITLLEQKIINLASASGTFQTF